MSASKLVRPHADYKQSYLDALSDYQREGRWTGLNIDRVRHDFDNWITNLCAARGKPSQSFQDWADPVPETILWLVKDREYIGTIEIRHRLNWHLERWGGHINYVVRPDKRGRGFGKKLLIKSFPAMQNLGLEKVLFTIDPDNKIARHIVEKCGATLHDTTTPTERFPVRCRYWLQTA